MDRPLDSELDPEDQGAVVGSEHTSRSDMDFGPQPCSALFTTSDILNYIFWQTGSRGSHLGTGVTQSAFLLNSRCSVVEELEQSNKLRPLEKGITVVKPTENWTSNF